MKDYLRLNEKNIVKYKDKYNLKGNGKMVHDHIILDSIPPHYRRLKLKNLKRFIEITDLSLDSVYLRSCKYITIQECKINHFDLSSCQNIDVRNNFITHFVLLYSRNCKITGNEISQDSYDIVKNALDESNDNKKLSTALGLVLIWMLFTFSYESWVYFYFSVLTFGMIIAFKIYFRALGKKVSDMPANVFRNNVAIPVEL